MTQHSQPTGTYLNRPTHQEAHARLLQGKNNTDERGALKSASRVALGEPQWFKKYMLYEFLDGGRNRAGVDCWGLIYAIYKHELGIVLPSYDDLSPQEQMAVSKQVEADTIARPWIDVPLNEMRAFDMVILRGLAQHEGRFQWMSNHMGIVTIPPYVMHIEDLSGVMHLPIMDTSDRAKDDLLSRRVRRIVRHEAAL